MLQRKYISLLPLLCLVAVSACGSDSSNGPEPASAPPTSAAPNVIIAQGELIGKKTTGIAGDPTKKAEAGRLYAGSYPATVVSDFVEAI